MQNERVEEQLAERARSLASARDVVVVLTLNVAAWWVGYLILGGSVLLAEGYEGQSFISPLHGPEFRVSEAVGWYSLLHALSVFLTLPSIAFAALGMLYEWVQIQRLRRRLRPC